MQEKFKESINVPVAVPIWGLVTFIFGGIYYAGATMNKLNTLLENYGRTEQRVSQIAEKQIGGLAAVQNLQTQAQNHENRIATLERAVIEKK